MNRKHLLIIGMLTFFVTVFTGDALAQVSGPTFIQVNPKGTYLFVETSCFNDQAEEPTSVSLSTLGIAPGMLITLRRKGAFKAGDAFNDDQTTLGAVFKGSSGFLFPGAGGNQVCENSSSCRAFKSIPTACSALTTDIPEDFNVAAQPTVEVPNGATEILFTPNDSFWNDNTDPNNDYGVEIFTNTSDVKQLQLFGVAHIGNDGESTLYRIDTATGVATPIGSGIGFERVSGLDFHPRTGVLYATGERSDGSNTHVLITVDWKTGVGSEVGPTGVESFLGIFQGRNTFTDISFRPSDGTLFAFSVPGVGLATVDLSTGAATQIAFESVQGELGFQANDGSALAFSPSGTLFHAAGEQPDGATCSGSPPLGGGGAPGCPDLLHIVDPATSIATIAQELLFPAAPPEATDDRDPRPNAMAFDPKTGVLFASIVYGFRSGGPTNWLGTFDVNTGSVTLLGEMVRGMDALAFFTRRIKAMPWLNLLLLDD